MEVACCLFRALYLLLFMQFSANSFYDPARRAITPTIVSTEKLPLATTLDSFAWSLVGAVGASLGGFAVSHLLLICHAITESSLLSLSDRPSQKGDLSLPKMYACMRHLNGFSCVLQVSHVGPNLCFVIDAVTYVISAYCAFRLKVHPSTPFTVQQTLCFGTHALQHH